MTTDTGRSTSRDTADRRSAGGASDDGTTYKEGAKDVAREARAQAGQVKEKVVEQSVEARNELQSQAKGLFKDLRGALADQIDRLGTVLRSSEREMREQRLDELAGYPARAADRIDDVNRYLRERSSRDMRRDFETAISRSPVAVLGGLAAVGALTAWYLRRDPAGVGRGGGRSTGSREGRRRRAESDRGNGSGRAGPARPDSSGPAASRAGDRRGSESGAERRRGSDGGRSGDEGGRNGGRGSDHG